MFNMHWYVIFAMLDMPALAKVDGGKGIGAKMPCQKCPIKGIHNPAKKSITTYYVPHWCPGDDKSQTDDLLANLQTEEFFKEVWHELTQATTVAKYKEVQTSYGITCVLILGLCPSINLIRSFPYGLMHLLFENLVPNLVLHWKGTFKNLDPSQDPYVLSNEVWEDIGQETVHSIHMTPSWMVRAMLDICIHVSRYTAESWAFWITWIMPYVLEDRLPPNHYQHLLLLMNIIKAITSLKLEEGWLDELEARVWQWHAEYEE